MADKLKVFKNQVNATASASLSAVPINVLTNDATTQAVVKDVDISVTHPNALYKGIYKYPLKAKVGDYPVAEAVSGQMTLTGSQIVDTNSSFSVEIQPEPQAMYYNKLEMMVPTQNGTYLFEYELANIGNPAGKGVEILTAIKDKGTLISSEFLVGNTGCTIMRNGELLYCYANGSNLFVINRLGASVATLSMPDTIYAICADSQFIYGKPNSSGNTIYRWSISSLTLVSSLSTQVSTTNFSNSNPGFIDHYNGFIYLRGQGSSSTIHIINTSTGAVGNLSVGSQTEHLGGLVTVNTSGVPFLVEYQDSQFVVTNLTNNTFNTYSGVFPTDPTTTSGNRAAVIANGIVLFNNGSYGTSAIVDVNGATPIATLVSSSFPMGNSSNAAMISKPFQTAPVQVSREIQYNLLASGIESTN